MLPCPRAAVLILLPITFACGEDPIIDPPPPVDELAGRIAFTSSLDADPPRDVYIMAADGSSRAQITDLDSLRVTSVALSRDGSKVAFAVQGRGIYVMDSDGSNTSQIWGDADSFAVNDLTWSPEGDRIAFTNWWTGPGGELHIVDSDGSDPRVFDDADLPGRSSPAWSPDGSRVAFSAGVAGVYVMNADGSNVTPLFQPGPVVTTVAWSPTGGGMAFGWTVGTSPEPQGAIFVMEDGGSAPIRITGPGESAYSPAWSPDGAWIAVRSDRFGGSQIVVMRPDGSDVIPLTDDGSNAQPSWGR